MNPKLYALFRSVSRYLNNYNQRRVPRRFSLSVDSLEDKTLLSTINVTSYADSGAGTLRAAVAAANNGDLIQFSGTGTVNLNSQIEISKNIQINGGTGLTTISGQDSTRLFLIHSNVTATWLVKLLMTHGYTDYSGGLIYNDHASGLNLQQDGLTYGSAARAGGALGQNGGTTHIYSTYFVGNDATSGGAIMNSYGNIYADSGSSMSYNQAWGNGGGIYTFGDAEFSGGTFEHNSAGLSGGFAVNNGGGYLSLGSATVQYNVSLQYGGAIINAGFSGGESGLSVTDTLFQGNYANYGGGAIANFRGGVWSVRGYYTGNVSETSSLWGNDILSTSDLNLTSFSSADTNQIHYIYSAAKPNQVTNQPAPEWGDNPPPDPSPTNPVHTDPAMPEDGNGDPPTDPYPLPPIDPEVPA